jgi:signal transduction histidine kinase
MMLTKGARGAASRMIMLDVAAAVGFALLPRISVIHPGSSGVSGIGASVLAAAVALPLCVRRVWPLPVFAWTVAGSLVSLPAGLAPTSLLAAAYAAYTVAVMQRRPLGRSAAIIGGASVAGAVGLTLAGGKHYQGGTDVTQTVLGLVVLGATWAAGAAIRERRLGVERAIEQAAERARIEERLRVAREFHDVATHSIGLIAVKAGVANHVLLTHPEEARNALEIIEQVSRTALRDLRTVLKILRPDQGGTPDLHAGPTLSDVPTLVDKARAANVDTQLETQYAGQPPQAVALSTYRIVQEALTNVIKHAAPTHCQVTIAAESESIRIEVTDDGPRTGQRAREAEGGLGLVGMRERVTAHNGALAAGPRPGGGFQVTAILRYLAVANVQQPGGYVLTVFHSTVMRRKLTQNDLWRFP